jgi:hypothetical protein
MKMHGKAYVYINVFLASALVGGEWSASRPGCFTPGEIALGTYWIRGWVGPRVSLDDVDRRQIFSLSGFELRPLRRPTSKQSLYRLRSAGSLIPSCRLVKLWIKILALP